MSNQTTRPYASSDAHAGQILGHIIIGRLNFGQNNVFFLGIALCIKALSALTSLYVEYTSLGM
jgi:hypothetical protein